VRGLPSVHFINKVLMFGALRRPPDNFLTNIKHGRDNHSKYFLLCESRPSSKIGISPQTLFALTTEFRHSNTRGENMKFGGRLLKSFVLPSLVLLVFPALTFAQHYQQANLVSDIMGMAPTFDPNLKNPWGLTRSSGSPFWVANNN
jgi:hypothetical protein